MVEQRSFGQIDSSVDEQNSSFIEQSPFAEERNASVSECSVGKNLFGKSDVPTLDNPFEQENTSQCAESINSYIVTNNESRQHNLLTLENGALEETLHFKQNDSVVQQSTINAAEISRPTANTSVQKVY